MTAMKKTKAWRTMVWLLTVAVVLGTTPLCVSPVAAQLEPPPRSILVMQIADDSGLGVTDLGRLTTGEVVLALTGQPGLSAAEFHRVSPQVQRAVHEGRLLPVQLEVARPSPAEAIQIAHAMKMDAVVLLTIESAVVTEQPHQAKLGLSGEIYGVAANFNEQTGDVAPTPQAERTLNVVGASREVLRYRGPERGLIREALKDAARQIALAVAGEPITPPAPKKGEDGTRWLTWILLLGGLAALVSSGTSSRAEGPAAVPAPAPISVTVQADGMRLRWQPPAASPGLVLLRYQIQRSINGSAWQYIDQGMVGAGLTEWFDGSLVSGTYRYRMSAVYTNQEVSAWVHFDQVAFP